MSSIATKNLTLHFDGACEPKNPGGIASGGWLIEDSAGEVVAEGCEVFRIGEGATNNYAEYCALGKGLHQLIGQSEKPASLMIRGDSQLVLFQISGAWKCNKEHLRSLRDRCRELIAELQERGVAVDMKWVPREDNELADALSRQAYEQHTGKAFPQRRRA